MNRMKSWGLFLLVLPLGLSGCAKNHKSPRPSDHAASVVKIAPPTPIQKKRVELGGLQWNHAWDAVIERSLPPAFLTSKVPQDVRLFCPRFYNMSRTDKRAFWAYFFQALAGAEAGLNPAADVRHTQPAVALQDTVTGHMIHSQGLLQLTYEDADRYGCDFDWKTDRKLSRDDPSRSILQPKNNLLCGIKILTRQIIVQHKPLVCSTSYWSTLRPGTAGHRIFVRQMANPPKACRQAGLKSGSGSQSMSWLKPVQNRASMIGS
jgi:hypothetical protein